MHSHIVIKCMVFKCNSYFHSKKRLQKHFKEKHEETEKQKKIQCAHCDYKTNDKTCFVQHFSIMHGTQKLKCSRCPKGARSKRFYKSKIALRIHMIKVHSDLETCPHCMEKMTMKAKKEHVQSDKCKICDKKCLCSGLMKKHRKICYRDMRLTKNTKIIGMRKSQMIERQLMYMLMVGLGNKY